LNRRLRPFSLAVLLAVSAGGASSNAAAQLSRFIMLDMNGDRGTAVSMFNGVPHSWNTFPTGNWELADLTRADGSTSSIYLAAQTDIYRSIAADGDYWPNWMPQQTALGRLGQITNALVDAIKGGASTNASFVFKGLDTNATYHLRLVGTKQAGNYKATKYTVSSGPGRATINELVLQTSGTNANSSDPTKDPNLNFNAVNLAVFRNLVPSALDGGSLVLDIRSAEGSDEFILNALELEEVLPGDGPLHLVDFGGLGLSTQPTYGAVPTTSPDANGNYWNNSAGGPFGAPGNIAALVDQFNEPSTIALTWLTSNSGVATANMGVTNIPSGSALASSPLNIVTALADSVFTSVASSTNSLRLSGLDSSVRYNVSLFASRTATNTRTTAFEVVGRTTLTNTVQTSGTNLAGAGLNYSVTPWTFQVAPDSNGRIDINYSIATGGFAYLNALSIQATTNPAISPGNPFLVDFGGVGASNQISSGLVPTASPDAAGNYWNNSSGGNFGQPSNVSNLIDKLNQPSAISLLWENWGNGVGSANFGVSNVLYPDLGIATAAQDGVYTISRTDYSSLLLRGLDPSIQYSLALLASRASTEARYTDFVIEGAASLTNRVQTSGTDLGGAGVNYNPSPLQVTVAPNPYGEIRVRYRVADIGGAFAYLNALSLLPTGIPSGNPTNSNPAARTAFGRWMLERGWTNIADLQPFADADGNGMANLLEYGLAAGSASSAAVGELAPGLSRSNGYLVMTYRQRTNDPSLSVRAEYTANLNSSWNPEGTTNGPVAIATNALAGGLGRLITVRAPEPMSAGSRGFLRAAAGQRLLVVGSSIMQRWTTITNDLAPVPVFNRAVDGSTAFQWLPGADAGYWESRVTTQDNPALMVYLGSNDIANGNDFYDVYLRLNTIVTEFWTLHPGAPVLYVSVIRSPLKAANGQTFAVDELNYMMENLAASEPDLHFVDINQVLVDAEGNALEPGLFTSDNNHLTATGYERINQIIRPALLEMWSAVEP
jgi:lysophospholipase L1-like esterase